MNTFEVLIEKLDIILKKYNPVEYVKLQPPLPNSDIDIYLQKLNIQDENIKTLFQWKNGEQEDSYCQMTEYGGLQSLKQIVESTTLDKPYDSCLVELISDNGEESLLFNTKEGPHYGRLYMYSVGQLFIDHPISYYDSLVTMVKTIIECYTTKAFSYDSDDNWLDIDFDKFSAIAKKHNKHSAYWKKHNPLKWEEWYAI